MGFKPFRPRLYPQPMPLSFRCVEALSNSELRNAETQNSELRNAETQNSELTNVEAQPLRTPNAGSAWGGGGTQQLRTQKCRTQKCRK